MLQNNILTADLIDARGNAKATTDAAWSVDGVFLGQGNQCGFHILLDCMN